ncbi:MAG: hypothetical protein ACLUZZ_00815 [Alistipes inops]
MAVCFHTEECTFLPQGRRRITAWIKEVITAEGYSPGDIAYIFCRSITRNQRAVSRPTTIRMSSRSCTDGTRSGAYRPHGTFQCGNHQDAAAGE